MFNPLYPFTPEVLQATTERGCLYFVRNIYENAFDHFEENIKGHFLFTHYNDRAKAEAHFNSIPQDPHRFLYDCQIDAHKKRLLIAANKPQGYKNFSAYFLPDYKKRISTRLKEKINRYMFRHTDWKPGRGETVHIDLFLQFGSLFVTMRFAGQELKVQLKDIEIFQ